jgi:hypothetical protein
MSFSKANNAAAGRQRLQVRLPCATLDRANPVLIIERSAVLRSNTTMLFTVFGAAFGLQLYVTHARQHTASRILTWDDRAFDTGSEKIWNGINKGVRTEFHLSSGVN